MGNCAIAGTLVIGGQLGNYLIEALIGRGGMSVVYRATHVRLNTPVAVKVLAGGAAAPTTRSASASCARPRWPRRSITPT